MHEGKVLMLTVTHSGSGWLRANLQPVLGAWGYHHQHIGGDPVQPDHPMLLTGRPVLTTIRDPRRHYLSCLARGEPHHLHAIALQREWLARFDNFVPIPVPCPEEDRGAVAELLAEVVGSETDKVLEAVDFDTVFGSYKNDWYAGMVSDYEESGRLPDELEEELARFGL